MAEIRIETFALAFKEPFRSARGVLCERRGVLLRLRDEGLEGLGEASPLPGFSLESLEEARKALEESSGALGELCRFDEEPPELLKKIGALLAPTPSARFAAESALLSFRAKKRGTQVAALLSRDPRSTVPINEVISLERSPRRSACLARALQAGISTFKIKLGPDLQANLEILEELREELPAACRLRGDANGCWGEEQALAQLRALFEFDLDYVEQPLGAEEFQALARLRGESPVAIAADESAGTLESIEALLALDAADVYVLKPTVLGGFAQTLAACKAVQARKREAVLSSSFEGPVGRRMCFELAAALPGKILPCGLATGRFLKEPEGLDGLGLRCGALYRKEALRDLTAL